MKNRIKELREKEGLTQKQLAKKAGLADNTLSQYETGKRHPRFEVWQKIADYFDVSVPYLQGYAEINVPNDLKFNSKQDAIECIEKIMKALDISKEDLRTEHENEFKKS